jgi:hypothetical protein
MARHVENIRKSTLAVMREHRLAIEQRRKASEKPGC